MNKLNWYCPTTKHNKARTVCLIILVNVKPTARVVMTIVNRISESILYLTLYLVFTDPQLQQTMLWSTNGRRNNFPYHLQLSVKWCHRSAFWLWIANFSIEYHDFIKCIQPGVIKPHLTWYFIQHGIASVNSKIKVRIDQIHLTGELWSVCCGDLRENWPRTTLYTNKFIRWILVKYMRLSTGSSLFTQMACCVFNLKP